MDEVESPMAAKAPDLPEREPVSSAVPLGLKWIVGMVLMVPAFTIIWQLASAKKCDSWRKASVA